MIGVGQVLFAFFEDYLKTQKGLRPGSVRSYRDTMKLFLGHVAASCRRPITRLQFADLSAQRVRDFLSTMRKGEWREGFIVRSHGEVTTVSADQECVFSDGFPDQSAQASAYTSAYPSAQVNGEKCIGECIPECIGQAEQQPNESSEYKESQKVFPEISKSFSAPSLLSYKPNSPLALESHTKSDGPEPSEADGFGNDLFFGNGSTEIKKDQNAADAFSGDPQRTAPKEEEEKEVDIPW
jgi:hypothetical protein